MTVANLPYTLVLHRRIENVPVAFPRIVSQDISHCCGILPPQNGRHRHLSWCQGGKDSALLLQETTLPPWTMDHLSPVPRTPSSWRTPSTLEQLTCGAAEALIPPYVSYLANQGSPRTKDPVEPTSFRTTALSGCPFCLYGFLAASLLS